MFWGYEHFYKSVSRVRPKVREVILVNKKSESKDGKTSFNFRTYADFPTIIIYGGLGDCYAEQVTHPSSIEQLGPAGISSSLLSATTSGITASIFLPPWFSTVNLTACDAACVRR